MHKIDNSKYSVILNLFRNDNNFMDSLDGQSELYKILDKMNVENDIQNIDEEVEDDELDEDIQKEKFEIAGYGENHCKDEEFKLNDLIKHGGPFLKGDAYELEYCKGRKKKKTLKKSSK